MLLHASISRKSTTYNVRFHVTLHFMKIKNSTKVCNTTSVIVCNTNKELTRVSTVAQKRLVNSIFICTVINCGAKLVSSYHKLTFQISQFIISRSTFIIYMYYHNFFFSQVKHNIIKNSMVNKNSIVFEVHCKKLQEIVQTFCRWEPYDAHSKRTCSADSLRAQHSGHPETHPFQHANPKLQKVHEFQNGT